MKKTIVLGYVKFPHELRRRKAVVEVELEKTNGKYYLCMRGEIKKYCYGQCMKEIQKYIVTPRKNFNSIMEIWEKYHLNNNNQIPDSVLNEIFKW